VLGEWLGECGNSGGLREQGADVAAAKGQFSGTQAARVRCAQGREQEEEADEMAVPQTHVLFILNEMQKKLDVGMIIRWGFPGCAPQLGRGMVVSSSCSLRGRAGWG